MRFSRSVAVMVGLSEEALPLVRRLTTDLPRRTVLAVFVADESPLVKLTRQIGARVVVCDLDDTRSLRVLVLRQRRFKVRALYLVSADVSTNLTLARRFRDIADTGPPAVTEPQPRITARIDDPWQAEYWRRTNAYRTPTGERAQSVRWVSDALSLPTTSRPPRPRNRHALGYRSWTLVHDRSWVPVTRRGEVHATVLQSDWRWQTRTGDRLQARVGDYQVRNGTGEA